MLTGAVPGGMAVAFGRAAILRHLPVAFLSVLYLVSAGTKAARTPLWFDEIITYSVSSLDGPRTIVEALLGRMDNHPPLDYLARYLSMALFGNSELAFRLPSLIGVLVAALCLYIFVLRRTSLLPALVAFALPFTTLALKYSYEGRGYAFLMASMGLAMLAWQLASEKPTIARLTFLTVALTLGPFSHFYGALNYAPIAAGEAWRWWERRRVSWSIVGCFLVSLAPLALLVPFALHAASFSGTFWTKLTPNEIAYGYSQLFLMASPGFIAGLLAFAVGVCLPSKLAARPPSIAVPRQDIVAAIVLCMLPFTTYLVALLVTKAYTYKYLLNTVFGVAILGAYVVYYMAAWRNVAAALATLGIGLWAAASVLYLGVTASSAGRLTPEESRLFDAAARPVLVLNSHEFLRLHHYLPQRLRAKLFFAADRKLALRTYGNDADYRALTNLKPFMPINFFDMCSFTKEHRHFLVLAYKPSRRIDEFLKDGAEVTVLSSDDTGRMVLETKLRRPSGC